MHAVRARMARRIATIDDGDAPLRRGGRCERRWPVKVGALDAHTGRQRYWDAPWVHPDQEHAVPWQPLVPRYGWSGGSHGAVLLRLGRRWAWGQDEGQNAGCPTWGPNRYIWTFVCMRVRCVCTCACVRVCGRTSELSPCCNDILFVILFLFSDIEVRSTVRASPRATSVFRFFFHFRISEKW